MKRITSLLVASAGVLMLAGCAQSEFSDLQEYMDQVRAEPKGKIVPLPAFTPYEAFTYSAAGMRSPFERPIKVEVTEKTVAGSKVRPDESRVKEYLEGFSMESFTMVGTLSNQKGFFGLVSGAGGVHPIKVGDYIGRNHGRIVAISEGEIQLIEIVPSGKDSWVERPRTLSLKD